MTYLYIGHSGLGFAFSDSGVAVGHGKDGRWSKRRKLVHGNTLKASMGGVLDVVVTM